MDRRQVLMAMGGVAASAVLAGTARGGPATGAANGDGLTAALDRIEARVGGRLGMAMLDTATGRRFARRDDERFPMCSTFKFILTANVLHAAERGAAPLARAVPVAARDIIGNSAISARHVGGTMTVAELCRATMTQSDNTAANLLLAELGGPGAVTGYLRSLGDTVTRLDGPEPVAVDNVHDTTSPTAMLATMRTLLLGDALTPRSRAMLTGWMIACRTGDTRLRAGFPRGWRVGDKTGTGDRGTSNDIAIAWPRPGRAPILVAAYLHDSGADQARAHAALADVGRAVAAAVG